MSTKTRKLSLLFRRSSACKKLNITTRSAMSNKDDSDLNPLVSQNPNPSIYTSKETLNIPTEIKVTCPPPDLPEQSHEQVPVKIHRRNSSSNSRNPLKEVHWSCPTLEKRREMILNYFENIMFVENNSNQSDSNKSLSGSVSNRDTIIGSDHSEPIYEEIRDSHSNQHHSNRNQNQDTLKPKLGPKKARLHQHSSGADDSPPDLQPKAPQPHIYDSLIKNCSQTNHNAVIYENLLPKTEIERNDTKRSAPLVVTWKLHEDNENFYADSNNGECLYAKVDKKSKANNSTKSSSSSSSVIEMSAQAQALPPPHSVSTTINKGGSAKESESNCFIKQFPVETEQDTILANGWQQDSPHPITQQQQQQQSGSSGGQEKNINIAHHDGCEEKVLPEKNLLEFQNVGGNSSRVVIDTTEYDPRVYSVDTAEFSSQEFDDESLEDSYDFPLPPPEFLNGENGHEEEREESNEFGYDYDYQTAEEIIWGEIDSDSIIENKEATKFYWEKRMRAGSTSDLTVSSMSLTNNRFLSSSSGSLGRQEKFYDDTEEDGGFESFQVANLTDDGSCDVDNGYEAEALDSLSAHTKGDNTSDSMITSVSPDQGVVLNYGNNNNTKKPAIKAHYRSNTFSQSQQSIPPEELQKKAATVLDLINSEISDLHMREIELKNKIRDVNSNTVNEDEGEDEGQQDGEQEELSGGNSEDEYNSDSAIDFESYTGTSNSSGNVTPASVFRGDSHTPNSEQDLLTGGSPTDDDELNKQTDNRASATSLDDEVIEVTRNKQPATVGRVRPLLEEEHKSFQMTTAEETPIEREIRLSRQREEEFRRLKSTSSIDTSSVPVEKERETKELVDSSKSNKQETISVIHQSTPRKVSRNSFIMKDNEVDGSGASAKNKDVQYELATARLRREIEENLMREKELYREGRLKSLNLGESTDCESSSREKSPDDLFESSFEVKETSNNVTTEKVDEHRNILPSQGKRPFGKLAIIKPEDKPMSTSSFSGPTVAPFTSLPPLSKRHSFESSSPEIGSEPKTPLTPHTPLSRPSFNSIERYLLKSSFKFSIGKRFDMQSPPENAAPEAKVEQVKATEIQDDKERKSSFDEVEEEKPRRKYIRAQDKIELELKEMVQREKELSQLRAKWKSTPDLSPRGSKDGSSGDEESSEDSNQKSKLTNGIVFLRDKKLSADDIGVGNVSISANKTHGFGKPTVRRRQSALINRWEELIKQQQQQQ